MLDVGIHVDAIGGDFIGTDGEDGRVGDQRDEAFAEIGLEFNIVISDYNKVGVVRTSGRQTSIQPSEIA
jgi:hypothetical protein